jgi:hypothetical protein
MKALKLQSCLAPQIQSFIRLRQLSGTDYQSQAQMLGYFDRFLVEKKLREPCGYSAEIGHRCEANRPGVGAKRRWSIFVIA